ncbi:hypothetical protein ACIOJD_04200 [Streptomyces sp. NPDC088116]|uniref:hypothetical protein n=1 Tax=Streptomyces sp. NPDC088116 TaxID=3365825 RepID=UPI00382A01C4
MPRRTSTAAITTLCVLALTSCGKSADDLFSNLNGTRSSHDSDKETPTSGAAKADEPPNYGDNSRAQRPDRPNAADEKRAREKAKEITRALEELRRNAQTQPVQVRPVLTRLASPAHLAVAEWPAGGEENPAQGSTYGIWIGKTACIRGVVSQERVRTEVNGHFPETGCLPPAPAH